MAPATLRIRLLGELDLRLGEEPLPPLGSARAESLLAYLLLHRDSPSPASAWPFCSGPTRASPRPGPTCATCCTSSTAGVARIRQALEGPSEGDHAPGMHAMVARVLLEACAVTGDARTGLVAADRALGLDDDVRTWESEARRRRGELLAALGAPGEDAEAELGRALEVARRQGARLLELRAAASLLHRRLDAGDDRSLRRARKLLASAVDAMPEGQNAPDLRDAAALLARA